MAQDIWRVTLRVIKQVTVPGYDEDEAIALALAEEYTWGDVITSSVEDIYKVED